MDNEVTTAKPSISWEQARDINSVLTLSQFFIVTVQPSFSKDRQHSLAYTLENELMNGQTYCLSVIAVDKHAASTRLATIKSKLYG